MWRNFAQSRLSDQLAMLVFDAHIPLARTIGDLTPLQWSYLLFAWNRRAERQTGEAE